MNQSPKSFPLWVLLQTEIHPEHHKKTRDSEEWNHVGHVRATKKETTLDIRLVGENYQCI